MGYLGSNPDISLKYKMGGHKRRKSQHTVAVGRQENIQKSNSHFTRTNRKIFSILDSEILRAVLNELMPYRAKWYRTVLAMHLQYRYEMFQY